jgi:hypothetical protein
MSIKNFKNPWVDEWKTGGKLHPDWLGGEQVLGDLFDKDRNNLTFENLNSAKIFDKQYSTRIILGGVNDYDFLEKIGRKIIFEGSQVQGISIVLLVKGVKNRDRLKIIQFLHHTNDDSLSQTEARKQGYYLTKDKTMLGKIDTGVEDNPSKLFYYTDSELNEFSKNYGDGEAEILFIDLPSAIWDKNNTPYKKTNFHTYLVLENNDKQHSFLAGWHWGFRQQQADYVGVPKLNYGFLWEDFQVLKHNPQASSELRLLK